MIRRSMSGFSLPRIDSRVTLLLEFFARLTAVRRLVDLIPGAPQRGRAERAHVRVVVRAEDLRLSLGVKNASEETAQLHPAVTSRNCSALTYPAAS